MAGGYLSDGTYRWDDADNVYRWESSNTVPTATRYTTSVTDTVWSNWTFDHYHTTEALYRIRMQAYPVRHKIERRYRPYMHCTIFESAGRHGERVAYEVDDEALAAFRGDCLDTVKDYFASRLNVLADQLDIESEPDARQRYERERDRIAIRDRIGREEAARQEEKAQANDRAWGLLQSVLNEDQKRTFERAEYIPVIGQSGKRYHIKKGNSVNVLEMSDDGVDIVRKLCAAPQGQLPVYDTMAAQVIFLQSAEADFLRIANVH